MTSSPHNIVNIAYRKLNRLKVGNCFEVGLHVPRGGDTP